MMLVKLSDQTGSYEVIGFSEEVQAFGAMLQPGANVIIGVSADERDDGISIKVQSVQPLDQAAQKAGKFLEIELDDDKSLDAIRKQLKPGGNGRILMRIARDQGKRLYEIDIGAGWQINPALAGAIKSFDGVVDVRLN
jgi:DNA polymerase-3 subunit alpha